MKNPRIAISSATLIFAAALLAVPQCLAQNERTGRSRPDETVIVASPDEVSAPFSAPAKPSPAIPAIAGPSAVPTALAKPADDPDAGIVTYVPSRPNELPEGALVKVRLRQPLSTLTTKPGTLFTTEITEALVRDGKVLVPERSVVSGRVTMVRSGRRIGGSAALHLEVSKLTLPDGSQYLLHARLIDTGRWNDTRVDSEGTIIRRDHAKGTLASLGLAAGSGMAAGAVIGGVPGALIGAGVGAGAGTVVWLKQNRQEELPKDLEVVLYLTSPLMVTPGTALVYHASTVSGE